MDNKYLGIQYRLEQFCTGLMLDTIMAAKMSFENTRYTSQELCIGNLSHSLGVTLDNNYIRCKQAMVYCIGCGQ